MNSRLHRLLGDFLTKTNRPVDACHQYRLGATLPEVIQFDNYLISLILFLASEFTHIFVFMLPSYQACIRFICIKFSYTFYFCVLLGMICMCLCLISA